MVVIRTAPAAAPLAATSTTSGLDPFAADLADPYALGDRLRSMGPAVRLPDYPGVWAVAGFDTAQAILRDPITFRSTGGFGPIGGLASQTGPGEIVRHGDPTRRDMLREILRTQLSTAGLRRRQPCIDRSAASVLHAALRCGAVDAVVLARLLVESVVADLVGLRATEGRDEVLAASRGVFAAFGPPGPDQAGGLEHRGGLRALLTAMVRGGGLAAGSLGADLLDAARAGHIDGPTVVATLAELLTGGIDPTVQALANLVWLLGTHTYEWATVQAGLVSVEDVVAEALRACSPIKVFTRTVTRDHRLGRGRRAGHPDIPLLAGQRVAVLFAAANRDPGRWVHPDRFWPGRPHRPHLAFGPGLRAGVGQALARVALQALTCALLDTAAVVHVDADHAVRLRHAVLNGFTYLPVTVRAAARAVPA
jgi:cytochrome P450